MTVTTLGIAPRAPATDRTLRWSGSLAIALTLHLLGAWGLLSWRAPAAPPQVPATAIMIDLAPPEAAPEPVPQQDVAPPEAAPEPAPEQDLAPPPPLEQIAPTLPQPVKPPKPHVVRPRPIETARPTPQETASPAPVAMPAPPQPAAPPVAAAPSNALPSFEALLSAHLDRYKRYPRAAQSRGDQGAVYVRFTMDREGKVLSFRLERSSGHGALDDEALALIRRAEPLPPIPPAIAQAPLELVVPIKFSPR